MEKYGIKIENYKCFDSPIGFDEIKPINVIIGKNNIGKSSLLDMIEFKYNNRLYYDACHKNSKTKLIINKVLDLMDFGRFYSNMQTGWCNTGNDKLYAETNLINKKFSYSYRVESESSFGTSTLKEKRNYISAYDFQNLDNRKSIQLAEGIHFFEKKVKRICAERNIVPEKDSPNIVVDGNGNGVTNLINKFINRSDLDNSFVQKKLLDKLNEIVGEDYKFTNIVVQTIDDKESLMWEIFLEDEDKGRIALSQSGSGLKTIIMLLVYTILIPARDKGKLEDYIFIFEELENNLHPSLQRNIIRYIESLVSEGATFFITTHSNVFIDSYSIPEDVNLYHLYKTESSLELSRVDNFLEKNSILNDVGFKASDILQSNGIIWVEGPSDRLYINKWISLWSNGELKEGKDYQCVFYGGRLLSHLTVDSDIDDLINLLKVNRNSIVLIDSDKNDEECEVNTTKNRIKEECEANNLICWITAGREIENYLSDDIIKKSLGTDVDIKFDQYQDIKDYLNSIEGNLGKKFESNKVKYAKEFIDVMTKDNCSNILDLNTKMEELVLKIRGWN